MLPHDPVQAIPDSCWRTGPDKHLNSIATGRASSVRVGLSMKDIIGLTLEVPRPQRLESDHRSSNDGIEVSGPFTRPAKQDPA